MKLLRRIALVLCLLVAALLAVVFVVGWRRPADHVATSRATFAAAPAAVWTRLADLAGWPEWNSGITGATREPDRDGKPFWRFEGSFGPMPMLVEEALEPTRLVTRIPADAGLGFSGTWTYELAPTASGGTEVRVTEAGHVESPFFRGVGALFLDVHGTMNACLRDLGRSFGEVTAPGPAPR